MTDKSKPAFPFQGALHLYDEVVPACYADGMTLREYYAGLAMQGLCANPGFINIPPATQAVEIADALIAELAKE